MAKIVVGFVECDFVPGDWNGPISLARKVAVNSACDYAMRVIFPEFEECDVIGDYDAIDVDWVLWQITIPINVEFAHRVCN